MKPDSLLGVWTGTAHQINGWDMKITISVLKPFETGSTLGIFNIPMIPCSGTFKVKYVLGETIYLEPENLQGDCRSITSASVELQADGTLLYVSKGGGKEARAILQRAG